MTAIRPAHRKAVRTVIVGAFAALLVAAAPAALATAAPHDAPATRAGEVIACARVSGESSSVFGQQCNTQHWGPLSDFVITGQGAKAAYRCRSGWAEGSLWVKGDNCQQVSQT
ncbi:hypothetical protein [Streptomyces sp. NPDC003077]|uniref:hypothetical protein n=1 Tax=Streptomyces sp. NPDC003077 TaxID=3154443 RepID=UPI0033BB537F